MPELTEEEIKQQERAKKRRAYDKLKSSHAELSHQLAAINEELQPMKDIRRWVSKVISPEQSEIENKPGQKQSITEKMKYYKEKEETQGKTKAMEQEVLN